MVTSNISRALADFRVLIIPGLYGSGPDHWQTRWQQLQPSFERVEQDDWNVPDLHAWSVKLDEALRRSSRPVIAVAHSFGCLATVHRAGVGASNLVGALLVAPADPQKFGLEERLDGLRVPVPSIVVGSTNDPWMSGDRAVHWSDRWGSEFFNAGPLGHINADSGLDDWRFGWFCLHQLVVSIKVRSRAVIRRRAVRVQVSV